MIDIDTKIEVETEDFTEELSDEALDRDRLLGRVASNWTCN